jgi:hypothetical protein
MNNILKMRTVSKIVFSIAVCTLLLLAPACNDILNVETERVLFTEDNKLNKADDVYYSAFGILRQFQALGEKYVILGELRADLMDVTVEADVDLQAISNHTATAANPYLATNDYYAVINNCNYYIQHADTSVSKGGYKVLYTEYALIKAIRAWTYFQLAINYGEATWLEKPLLSLADINEHHDVYDLNTIINLLIEDLLPYDAIDLTGNGGLLLGYDLDPKSFVSIPLLLADLYLWKQDYLQAAERYYQYIYTHNKAVTSNSRFWDENFEYIMSSGWPSFSLEEMVSETLFGMKYSVEKGFPCPLMNKLAAKIPGDENSLYMLKPSDVSSENWNKQIYTYYDTRTREIKYNQGDLRGGPVLTRNSSGSGFRGINILSGGSYNYFINEEDTMPFINKFVSMSMFGSYSDYYNSTSEIYLYRTSTLYLHFAEALNQLDKPTLAFAILKHGLTNQNVRLYVDQSEITPTPSYADFDDFYNNSSIRMHGLGYAEFDTTYVIPSNEAWTRQDTINFVDTKILEELALETAFEGNRYGDLIRFSDRRNDPSILAKAIARKNPGLESRLMNRANWFLPVPK